MKCIAIDDEPLALNVIKDFCSKIDFLELEGSFFNAIDASKAINDKNIDLIFIDINMPNLSGLDFVKTLKNPPLIIFTTAYAEHALKGYELNAIDYLLKPIPFDRFFQAVNKAYEFFQLKNANPTETVHVAPGEPNQSYILVKAEYATVRVDLAEILFIEGIKDYVKIKMGDRQVLTKCTMKAMEEKLPSENFIRVHKSYIISMEKIDKIENNRVYIGSAIIPIGNSFKADFNQAISKYRL